MTLPIVHHPAYEVDIGAHVFPTAKYRMVRDRLLGEQPARTSVVHQPEATTDAFVSLVHTEEYLDTIRRDTFSPTERLILEVPFSPPLRDAMWLCAGGAVLTARLALEAGIALHLGGGFHHAFPDHGEGFCLIHDVAIAIRALQREQRIQRALIVDCDVHHGNGTAVIFASDTTVFTFSMHQERNYPAWKPPSDLDLGLEDGTGDTEYLALLRRHLPTIVERHRPDLTYYLAGADPYRDDQLGGLALTIDGLAARDRFVLETLRRAGGPVAIALAGGYARDVDDTVEIHCNTARVAERILASTSVGGLSA